MDAADWRTQLQPDSRNRIVNKIMETLKRHLPISRPEGLIELRKIAVRFEEKIYSAATSQSDYLRKISLKLLTMETKSQNPAPNAADGNQNLPDPAENLIKMDGADWRSQLRDDSRHRIVNKIMETLKRHLSISSPDGLIELRKMAVRFEEKIYSAATSESDYLRKISLKMLTMETKSQNLTPSVAGGNQSLPYPDEELYSTAEEMLEDFLYEDPTTVAAEVSCDK